MKQFLTFLLFGVLIFALPGCEENSTISPDDKTEQPNEKPDDPDNGKEEDPNDQPDDPNNGKEEDPNDQPDDPDNGKEEDPNDQPDDPDNDNEEELPDGVIPDNEIHYVATARVVPDWFSFGSAAYLSNEWDETTGKGVITFADAVREIGFHAFVSSIELTEIIIPNTVTTIAVAAFDNCYNLTSITLPEALSSIEVGAFLGCWSLTTFKGGLASSDGRCLIQDGNLIAFAPAGLNSYTIPDGVLSIGTWAFSYDIYGITCLSSITIPDSVTSIGEMAFQSCRGLKEVTLGNGIVSIGEMAFQYCENLTTVTIPENVTWIGNSAFENCTNLREIYCKPITPPMLATWLVFWGHALDRKFYVPVGSGEAYQTAEIWDWYAEHIEEREF